VDPHTNSVEYEYNSLFNWINAIRKKGIMRKDDKKYDIIMRT